MKIKFYISFVIFIFILAVIYCENTDSENFTSNSMITSSTTQESTWVSATSTTIKDYNCLEPLQLNTVSLPYTATNTFTNDSLPEIPSCATSVNNVIVYNYVANISGTITIECTNGTLTNAHSRLVVYDSSCHGIQLLCGTSNSRVISLSNLFVTKGYSYMIAFFTNNEQAMMVNPKINIETYPIPQIGEECSQAIALTRYFSGMITPSSIMSLPSKPLCFSATSFNWYSYPALTYRNITLNLSSNTPIDIAFYTGSTCSNLTLNSCFANTTYGSATLNGSSCWIVIGNNNTSPIIQITESPSPFGENCSNPINLVTGSQTVFWSASSLDYSSSLSSLSCIYAPIYSPDVIFTYTTGPTAGAYIEINFTSNNTEMYYIVYDDCPDIGNLISCNILCAFTIPNVQPNHKYYIVSVPPKQGFTIPFPMIINVTEKVPALRESCNTSQPLNLGLNLISNSSNQSIQSPTCLYSIDNKVWHSFTPSFSILSFELDVQTYFAVLNSDTEEIIFCDYVQSGSIEVKPGTKYCFVFIKSFPISSITLTNSNSGTGESCSTAHHLFSGSNSLTFSSSKAVSNPSCIDSGVLLEWYSYNMTGLNNLLNIEFNNTDHIAVYLSSGQQMICSSANSISLYFPTSNYQICLALERTSSISNMIISERSIHNYLVGTSIGTFSSIADTECQGTGMLIPGSQTSWSGFSITLPFDISLYGKTYLSGSQWYPSTFGVICYTQPVTYVFTLGCYPISGPNYGLIAVVNKSLDLSDTYYPNNNGIWTCVEGISPNRTWKIEFRGHDYYSITDFIIAQIVFHEGSSNFEVIYGECDLSTEIESNFITAIQNQNGAIATNGHCTIDARWNTYSSGYSFNFTY